MSTFFKAHPKGRDAEDRLNFFCNERAQSPLKKTKTECKDTWRILILLEYFDKTIIIVQRHFVFLRSSP